MHCVHCGSEMKAFDKFCRSCGEKQAELAELNPQTTSPVAAAPASEVGSGTASPRGGSRRGLIGAAVVLLVIIVGAGGYWYGTRHRAVAEPEQIAGSAAPSPSNSAPAPGNSAVSADPGSPADTIPDRAPLAEAAGTQKGPTSPEGAATVDELGLVASASLIRGLVVTSGTSPALISESFRHLEGADSDYSVFFQPKGRIQLAGQDIVFLENERFIEWVGCCPAEGLVFTLRIDGDTTALRDVAASAECKFPTSIDFGPINDMLGRANLTQLPEGNYLQLDCRGAPRFRNVPGL